MEDFSQYLRLINNCDPNYPLLSTTSLGKRLAQIPLRYVSPADLLGITQALNLEQLIPTESGLARDYRGLAELMGFKTIEIETRFKRSHNPTKSLIDTFVNNHQNITLNDLLKLIECIERFDVVDDLVPTLVDLASGNRYQYNNDQLALRQVNSSTSQHENSILVNDLNHLAIDGCETNLATNIPYDAYICYAPEDIHYAQELIRQLEERNKRVATSDHILAGHFEHDALIKLIGRCRKVIIILTPNFLRSKECDFQTKFASELGINDGKFKIIPVLYEACDEPMPTMIQVLSKIDMTNSGSGRWQFERLVSSLEVNISSQPDQTRYPSMAMTNQNQQHRMARMVHQIESQNPIPAITFACNSQATTADNNGEPVVDLLYSQYSDSIVSNGGIRRSPSNNASPSICRKATPSPPATQSMGSNNPIKWFKRRLLGNSSSFESLSPSTSSQAPLITANLSDFSDDDHRLINHRNQCG